MTKCQYTTKYFDYKKKEPSNFECKEEAHNGKLCIFHDDKYDNEEQLIKQLTEKLKNSSKNEPLFFIGYQIPSIRFEKSFPSTTYFTRTKLKNADFSGTNFQKVDFSGAKIDGVNFSGTKFEEADFLTVDFKKKSDFSHTVFHIKVNFSESVFEDANFGDSVLKKAQFIGTKFETVDFGRSELDDCDFFGASFEKEASFIGTKLNRCRFPSAEFHGKSTFTGAKLKKNNFRQCKFKGINLDYASLQVVVFQNAKFLGNANFSSSKLEKVDFFKTDFAKNLNFSESDLKEVVFSETGFNENVLFVKTLFDETKFKNVEFKEASFSEAKFVGKTFFDMVIFKNQDKVNFDVSDLSKVSFKNSDVTKVRFGENIKWGGKDGFTIIDEEMLKNNAQKTDIETLIASYRNLRKNYENRLRFEEAKKFLAKEIHLKKLYEGDHVIDVKESNLLLSKLEELAKDYEGLKKEIKNLEKKIDDIP